MKYSNKKEISDKRNYVVVKSNELIRNARYELSLQEQRLLSFIFSKIKPTDTVFHDYQFSLKEYCQVCGIDYTGGGNMTNIKNALKSLRDKSFWIRDENGCEKLMGWIQKAVIDEGQRTVSIRLDDDIQKYVIGLRSDYTQYSLLSTLPMKSSYSIRLYELLKSYAFLKRHSFKIEELRKILMAENVYINFKDFRRAVLEKSTSEINMYTDIEVEWEPVFKGRKVIEIDFRIKQLDSWGAFVASCKAEEQIEGQISLFDYDYYS